ncbi:MAG TPA: tryptophan--tRNA ligase [Pseudomonadales bacterium]|nr:tryptophan--tRNA ligase [Pseudomonadales bacterium]HMW14089.1 tryptophan--tRNA ligase [Pseudomonadales bacterium]HMW82123.1 tryptophan--tRNA ligase [Pseudomonadales bacterium]HMY96161.1 tryptophan--tRNA ligase [Pseudomonadales bacterium]HMZ69810.1 tryptophan--tRNA ligase [Pseudomonadales bacterium]
MSIMESRRRVLSGMRPTGKLHLGHYGNVRTWARLQQEYECYFFVADWHALTTHYESEMDLEQNALDMVIDWLAAGVNPSLATLFVQSQVPEHAELHLLLSMITPLGWLERVPSYKDQQEQLKEQDLATYGFLGYPLLQSADILAYRAGVVPVGADQVAHVELTREVARRFNHLYGGEQGFRENAEAAAARMGKKLAKLYVELRRAYQEQGDGDALERARILVREQPNLSLADRERLMGYLEGDAKVILPEPQALLTPIPKMPGLDGRKMSKSYGNTLALRDPPELIEKKILTMQTDPARVRRSDPGDPDKCPVWQFHQIYSDGVQQAWVREGCSSAGIGCVDCKRPIIDSIQGELRPLQLKASEYEQDLPLVRNILKEGNARAREEARATLDEVREVMGLRYR